MVVSEVYGSDIYMNAQSIEQYCRPDCRGGLIRLGDRYGRHAGRLTQHAG